MEKIYIRDKYNKTMIFTIVIGLLTAYFSVDVLGGISTWGVDWYNATVLTIISVWILSSLYSLYRISMKRQSETAVGIYRAIQASAYWLLATTLLFRLLWPTDIMVYGYKMLNNTNLYQLFVTLGLGLNLLLFNIYIYFFKPKDGNRFKVISNLGLWYVTSFFTITTIANFAPNTFGIYSSTNPLLGIYRNYPAYILYTVIMMVSWMGLFTAIFLFIKNTPRLPWVKNLHNKSFKTTSYLLFGFMLIIYVIDHSIVNPAFGIKMFEPKIRNIIIRVQYEHAFPAFLYPDGWVLVWADNLWDLVMKVIYKIPLFGRINAIQLMSAEILSAVPWYGGTMLSLTSLIALFTITIPIVKWWISYGKEEIKNELKHIKNNE